MEPRPSNDDWDNQYAMDPTMITDWIRNHLHHCREVHVCNDTRGVTVHVYVWWKK